MALALLVDAENVTVVPGQIDGGLTVTVTIGAAGGVTVSVCDIGAAAAKSVLPAWLAVMVVTPADRI